MSDTQIRSLLAEMTPSTVRVDLQTTAFDSVNAAALPNATGHPTPGREPWFGFDFVTFDLQPALLQQWASPSISPELALPPPNTFIATDFALVGGPRPKEEPWPCTPPCLLLDRPGLRYDNGWLRGGCYDAQPKSGVWWIWVLEEQAQKSSVHFMTRPAAAIALSLPYRSLRIAHCAYQNNVSTPHNLNPTSLQRCPLLHAPPTQGVVQA